MSVNNQFLGTHKGGFSTFCYELTNHLKSEDNLLTVDVTNEDCDVYPQMADFTFYGGLYRNVTFIETEPAHFDLLKHGTGGVFVTPHCAGKTRFDLFPVDAEGCNVSVTIYDADGNKAADGSCEAASHTVLTLSVREPHLWNGVKDPYCYSAVAVLEKDGIVLDEISIAFGYRGFRVDAETGFYLNGKSYPLRGVSRHQDRQDKGWALEKSDHEEDISIIREIGSNTIRLAHYQHDQYFYDLCDRNGLVLWAEIRRHCRRICGISMLWPNGWIPAA